MTILDPTARSTAAFLVGRGADVERIRAIVGLGGARGGALLLTGDPGIGKSALLDFVAEEATAAGVRVLRAGGVEMEADICFSVLNQVLLPLLDELALLPGELRDALEVALGFRSGPVPDPAAVAHAALAVLREAGDRGGVLLVVDDVQWIDAASAAALGYVAPRLERSRVAFLGALRCRAESTFPTTGIDVHEVPPLDADSAAELVSVHHPMLAPRLRRRLLAESRGNPLALVELPTAMTRQQQLAPGALPAVLPLSRRLQDIFSARVAGLPSSTRLLLLEAALDSTGEALEVGDGSGRGDRIDELAPAVHARLLRVDPFTRRLSFHHPLTRAAVVELSTADERRRIHRTLADRRSGEPDRRAWHLAEAAIEPDEVVAATLEDAGRRMLDRADAAGAITAWTRAAGLSPRPADRSRRLAQAAFLSADVTGELQGAAQLLAEAQAAEPGGTSSLQTAVTAAYVRLMQHGDVDATLRLLTGAIEATSVVAETRECARLEALTMLLRVSFLGARPDLWEPFRNVIAEADPDLHTPLGLMASVTADPARAVPAQLARLDAAIAALDDEVDPTRIERIARVALFVDRADACREPLWRVVRDGRSGGAVTSAIQALTALCLDDFQTGRWDESQELAAEGLELCSLHGYRPQAAYFRYAQALRAAARGDAETTRGLADALIQWAGPRGAGAVRHFAHHARLLAALGQGDYDEAYRCASSISEPGRLPPLVQPAVWIGMDLVEAAVRTDRHAEAIAHVRVMRETNLASLSPRLGMLVAAAEALVADDDGARRSFSRALAIPGIERWPFDRARVQLLHGERLRRARATSESRPHLKAALATFERLGARPWADRAAAELQATGEPATVRPRAGVSTLTGQESTIATLAARGLTNKSIAAELNLSHRTIGAHLSRVFQKVGINSRAALRDALEAAA